LWARLEVDDISNAEQALGLREYPGANDAWIDKNIGSWSKSARASRGRDVAVIRQWAVVKGFNGVVWTNLPCKFNGVSDVMPTATQILDHLRRLTGDERATAETYVRRTPQQIDTDYRRVIEKELGWNYR
jgi:hypothetical protein